MSIKYYLIYFLLTFLVTTKLNAQISAAVESHENTYFISINYGAQMSGIKDEDFINSNYSPLFNITAGKWFNQKLALQLGYKGFFFYTIADDIKHHYNYLYAEGVINFNNLVDPDRTNKNWSILLHGGPGYFYNHVYERASIHINLGIQHTFQLTNSIHTSLDIASIVGWDIYQGDEDILPGVTLGVTYLFNID